MQAKVTDEELDSATATAKTYFGICPGSYDPGLPTPLEPEQSPENQAAEVAEIKGSKGSWQPKLPAAQAAEVDIEKSSGSGGSKGSWKPKTRSDSKVKSEQVEVIPSETAEDALLDDAIQMWQQEMEQPKSPSSPVSLHPEPDDTAVDSPRSVGSDSFEPDWEGRHATGEPDYDERHDREEPDYDSRHDPQEQFAREGQASLPRAITLTLLRKMAPSRGRYFMPVHTTTSEICM